MLISLKLFWNKCLLTNLSWQRKGTFAISMFSSYSHGWSIYFRLVTYIFIIVLRPPRLFTANIGPSHKLT